MARAATLTRTNIASGDIAIRVSNSSKTRCPETIERVDYDGPDSKIAEIRRTGREELSEDVCTVGTRASEGNRGDSEVD